MSRLPRVVDEEHVSFVRFIVRRERLFQINVELSRRFCFLTCNPQRLKIWRFIRRMVSIGFGFFLDLFAFYIGFAFSGAVYGG